MSKAVRSRFTLRAQKPALRWLILLCLTGLSVALLQLLRLSAALLLGSMLAAIALASAEGAIKLPELPHQLAQGVIGCLIARSINADILREMVAHWPVFLFSILSVVVFSTLLGGLLARLHVLPGPTAVWGAAPGAATVMTLMAEGFGADARLVAFMQFLRVALVTLVASLVTRMWGTHGSGPALAPALALGQLPSADLEPLVATLALAAAGAMLGARLKLPAGALLVPMFIAVPLAGFHVIVITLPQWLLAGSYVLVGWAIGLRFTRDIVVYAARAFPKVTLSICTLIALCGGLGYGLHSIMGIDALTAYLATSPGGADSVAIIAASSNVDLPFVMAMQTARFLLMLSAGPSLARLVTRWAVPTTTADAPGAELGQRMRP